ncbi:MAG: hypothetical protein EO766_11785 [Hydrotalea sp. AMD]|uniref:hypothetical protein n=1 Tax=Hydrotalea sp. AMD TaxID=2501297 RepID=UPI0010252659|nr:hypothetical protein [Hydrotalea sp. AMD]RWZ87205.1 MAG: hypothetical protein EO766_11785 [Hydrotalea sp. AMD]
MKLFEIAQYTELFTLTNEKGQTIATGLTFNKIKKIVNDPQDEAKYGRLRVIKDAPNEDWLTKKQGLVNYDKPVDNEDDILSKHQAF